MAHYRPYTPPYRPPPQPPTPPPPPPPEVLESGTGTEGRPRCYFCGKAIAEEQIRKTDYDVGYGQTILVMICPACHKIKERGQKPAPQPPRLPPSEVLDSSKGTQGQPRCYFCGKAIAEEQVGKTDCPVGSGHTMLVMICPPCYEMKVKEQGPWAVPEWHRWRQPLGLLFIMTAIGLGITAAISIKAQSDRYDKARDAWWKGNGRFENIQRESGLGYGFFLIPVAVITGFIGLAMTFGKPRVIPKAAALLTLFLCAVNGDCSWTETSVMRSDLSPRWDRSP